MSGDFCYPWKYKIPINLVGRVKEMRRQKCFSGAVVTEDLGGEFVTIECEDELDRALLCALPGLGWVVP
jgi:hypothetical protein